MEALGVATLYCRYDGGSDEAWASIDHAILDDGTRLAGSQLIERVRTPQVVQALAALNIWRPQHLQGPEPDEAQRFRHVVDEVAMYLVAKFLNGDDFGTGPLLLYGACIVDMKNKTVTEDPRAQPPTDRRWGAPGDAS